MGDLTIGGISQVPLRELTPTGGKQTAGFGDVLKGAINRVDGLEKDANKHIVDLLRGEAHIDETMIAIQKADISMRLLITVRNKVIDAYREVMRMHF